MMKNSYFFILALFISCNPSEKETLKYVSQDDFDWLEGSWAAEGSETSFYEIWETNNEAIRRGIGVVLSGADTVSIENLEMITKDDKIHYSVRISNQNNGKTIFFELESFSDSIFVFSNPRHDFLKRISYQKISETEMEVVIDEGKATGKTEMFNFKKE